MYNILKKAERKKFKRKRFKCANEKEKLPIFFDKANDIYNNYVENTIRLLEEETEDFNLELREHIISNISLFNITDI